MSLFLHGASFIASLFIAFFFMRFYSRSRERLFAIFSVAFLALGVERVFIAFMSIENEAKSLVYIIRLLAFIFLIWGIAEKNRKE